MKSSWCDPAPGSIPWGCGRPFSQTSGNELQGTALEDLPVKGLNTLNKKLRSTKAAGNSKTQFPISSRENNELPCGIKDSNRVRLAGCMVQHRKLKVWGPWLLFPYFLSGLAKFTTRMVFQDGGVAGWGSTDAGVASFPKPFLLGFLF